MTVPDHRVTGRCTYALSDLLTIVLLTYICGGEDYVDMSEFAYYRARDFGLLADCPERSPSPDIFERLMSAVEPDEIERCLIEHGRKFLDTIAEKQVVIDGKKLRGTSPKRRGTKGDYIMNAYVSENHIVVGQQRLEDKEN
ncbi:MAG: ISAs1 family transposase [Barnesiella sp.]|nr:ISAs1 family transposase [Barnesiella sp.]